jgi:hypothetical protein
VNGMRYPEARTVRGWVRLCPLAGLERPHADWKYPAL